jgi:hypothetical protein
VAEALEVEGEREERRVVTPSTEGCEVDSAFFLCCIGHLVIHQRGELARCVDIVAKISLHATSERERRIFFGEVL